MRITSLSNEAFGNLASVLNKDSTIGWKKLMIEGFSGIYSQKDVEEIEQKSSPAIALLNDLDGREESLENLITALDRIGNKRAISIINNGSCHRDGTFKTGQLDYYQGCDGRGPHINSREPSEHNDVPPNREQAQTLDLPPYSIQESIDNFKHCANLEPCELLTNIISQIFPFVHLSTMQNK